MTNGHLCSLSTQGAREEYRAPCGELLDLCHSLDIENRAEIRGEIKGTLKAAKYKSKIKGDEAI